MAPRKLKVSSNKVTVGPGAGEVVLTRPPKVARPHVEIIKLTIKRKVNQPLGLHIFVNQPGACLSAQREGNPHYVSSAFFLITGASGEETVNISVPLGPKYLAMLKDKYTLTIVPSVRSEVPKGVAATITAEPALDFGP